jgi:acyl-CoA synthetase (AMP-forming)/AMP-acid ligase II
MIITGGENVWPDAVERALLAYPGISDCAVFGAPDPKWGETVCAVFEASAPIDQSALKEFLGASLPGFSIPKKLNQVENLPRTPSGKIDRRALSN